MKNIFLTVLFLVTGALYGQYGDKKFSVNLKYSYTTTSRLYLYPNAADPLLRDEYKSLDHIYSYSGEVKYRISEPLFVGLSVERIEKTGAVSYIVAAGPRGIESIPVNEGFIMVPVELTLYYLLPFSTDSFKFYMGGGGGYYIGTHIRDVNNIEAVNIKRENTLGIHVLTGFDYLINDFLSAGFEMRFRDPQTELQSAYSDETLIYRGNEYKISRNQFTSEVNVDGITFSVGLSYRFGLGL